MSEDKILNIVQARMGSHRLPGKAALELNGKPLLVQTLEAVLSVFPNTQIAVATSIHSSNDIIEGYCQDRGISCHRGDEDNVAERFKAILLKLNPKTFSRINGDSPAFDPRTLLKAADLQKSLQADLVTTVGGGFPSGMNVEVMNAKMYLDSYPHFHLKDDFEHVTPYFYRVESQIRPQIMKCAVQGASQCKFSVDVKADYDHMQKIFQRFVKPHFDYSLEEKCEIYRSLQHKAEN